jgi:SAM-dependent methyltransferase
MWEEMWSHADFAPSWLGRGISREIVEAVESGWFPAGGAVLDIGCGQGEVAHWLFEQGFPTLGIDISAAAIERARTLFGASPGRLEFQVLDICAAVPRSRRFSILIDRGCFHQIPAHEAATFARNIASVCVPGARFLLLHKAFRNGVPPGDPIERERVVRTVRRFFGNAFSLERVEVTSLGDSHSAPSAQDLPGLAFWMIRR